MPAHYSQRFVQGPAVELQGLLSRFLELSSLWVLPRVFRVVEDLLRVFYGVSSSTRVALALRTIFHLFAFRLGFQN